jgi:hypothetical protein
MIILRYIIDVARTIDAGNILRLEFDSFALRESMIVVAVQLYKPPKRPVIKIPDLRKTYF